jgi:hypothetical protein
MALKISEWFKKKQNGPEKTIIVKQVHNYQEFTSIFQKDPDWSRMAQTNYILKKSNE